MHTLIVRLIDRTLEAVCATLVAAMCMLVFVGVIFRYALGSPLGWVEEVARGLLVWLSFLGAYLGIRRAQHVGLEITLPVPDRLRRILAVAVKLLLSAVFMVMVRFGIAYAVRFMNFPTPYLRLPQGWVYLSLPVAAALYILAVWLPPATGRGIGRDDEEAPK